MLIDADCHISPLSGNNLISAETLLKMMDKASVDKALIWLAPPYTKEINESNHYIFKSVKAHPDRFLGFGWADPNLGIEKAKDAVKKCIYDYGFFGVKLNGAQNEFFIDDPQVSMPVVEEIAKTGKFIAFHCGADAYERTHPFRIAKIARRFPQMQILCVHMGGVNFPDITQAAIELAREHSNVTLIGSNVGMKPVLNAVKTLGADRLCFGSDTPFALMHVCVAMYNALLEGEVASEDKAKIMGGNLLRLFRLQ
jgi:predicted TIM-barrel fold metal-dependent hydrolase